MDRNISVCLDGNFYPEDEKLFGAANRGFRYGDGLFETMHVNGTRIQFFSEHFSRLTAGMKLLKMNIPADFTQEYTERLISKLLNRNKFLKGAKIRLTVFRKDGGLFAPETNEFSFLIESAPLLDYKYQLNEKGLKLGLYLEHKKEVNEFCGIKSANSLIFVLAGIYKKSNFFDECIIMNSENRISETVSSNIFIVRDNEIFTPPLSEGCLPGIMRSKIIELAGENNFVVSDRYTFVPDDLAYADEIFLTNVINGIRWVGGFRQKRYFNFVSKKLVELLNGRFIGL
ncbi:MAG: hypothetical protein A2W91_15575 [Bacteroidetes bacterium GWF2_38_335]|nr:MAG: hypothetical protein A2W91_15575 [Bacteroidetes bacterium GWF2_38_335]OFY81513.1 MAG: hypothetical protein A2281_11435 [Bacteroidetes bacterium RIFOXYA12_FULL_38_20]HBS87682.1 hypothetical protein [Bacteroidales bacterium]